jgi:hypothetical protein
MLEYKSEIDRSKWKPSRFGVNAIKKFIVFKNSGLSNIKEMFM